MPTHQRRPGATLLTPADAARAIYVDYECSMDRDPTLLGYLIGNILSAGIVEQSFSTCAGRRGCRYAVAENHQALAVRLVEQAVREERVIVSWSEFDFDHLYRALRERGDLRLALRTVYRNARYTAKRWRRRRYPSDRRPHTLDSYLRRVRFVVPPEYGPGVVGSALRGVREQLTAGRGWATVSPGARQAWRVVIRHNAFDLRGLQRVVCFVAAKMAHARVVGRPTPGQAS